MTKLTVTFGVLLVVAILAYKAEAVGHCPSFCDNDGFFHDSRHCHHRPEVYCCGSAFRRYCCSNSSQDISGYYPERYNCDNRYSWLQIHWQVMITMTGTVVLVLLCSACCCQCCKVCGDRARLHDHRINFSSGSSNAGTTIITDADGNQVIAETTEVAEGGETGRVMIQMFNPESPYAFTPPDYESLPKEPPKYNDVFGADGGNINPCYVPDTPPPPFSEVAEAPVPSYRLPTDSIPDYNIAESREEELDTETPVSTQASSNISNHEDNRQNKFPSVPVGDVFVDVDLTEELGNDEGVTDTIDEVPTLLPPAQFQDVPDESVSASDGQLLSERSS